MIYPLTEQTPVLQHNAALQRYVRRYADIEKQTQQAIAQYGLSFESPYRRQAETDALRLEVKALGAVFANNGKSIHSRWLSSAGCHPPVCSAAPARAVTPRFYP